MSQWDDKDWYRSSAWNEDIAAAFETGLRRARASSRAQYLRIQGTHLAGQPGLELRRMGRALFQRVIDEYSDTDPNEAKCASEQLAMSLLEDGYRDDAEAAFRRTLLLIAQSPIGRSYTTGLTDLSLAELLYSKGDRASQLEAWQLLDAVEESAVGQGRLFRDAAIRYLVARARVATALRDPAAASFARAALEIADETTPSIPRHPTLGRPCASDELRFELTSIEARFSRGVNRRRAPFARRATSARRS